MTGGGVKGRTLTAKAPPQENLRALEGGQTKTSKRNAAASAEVVLRRSLTVGDTEPPRQRDRQGWRQMAPVGAEQQPAGPGPVALSRPRHLRAQSA